MQVSHAWFARAQSTDASISPLNIGVLGSVIEIDSVYAASRRRPPRPELRDPKDVVALPDPPPVA